MAKRPSVSPARLAKAETTITRLKGRMARIRGNESRFKNRAIGGGAGYIAAGWWAERQATEDAGGDAASFSIGGYEITGERLGMGVSALGAIGYFDDDMYNEVAFGAGLGVAASARGIASYKAKMAEPPSE